MPFHTTSPAPFNNTKKNQYFKDADNEAYVVFPRTSTAYYSADIKFAIALSTNSRTFHKIQGQLKCLESIKDQLENPSFVKRCPLQPLPFRNPHSTATTSHQKTIAHSSRLPSRTPTEPPLSALPTSESIAPPKPPRPSSLTPVISPLSSSTPESISPTPSPRPATSTEQVASPFASPAHEPGSPPPSPRPSTSTEQVASPFASPAHDPISPPPFPRPSTSTEQVASPFASPAHEPGSPPISHRPSTPSEPVVSLIPSPLPESNSPLISPRPSSPTTDCSSLTEAAINESSSLQTPTPSPSLMETILSSLPQPTSDPVIPSSSLESPTSENSTIDFYPVIHSSAIPTQLPTEASSPEAAIIEPSRTPSTSIEEEWPLWAKVTDKAGRIAVKQLLHLAARDAYNLWWKTETNPISTVISENPISDRADHLFGPSTPGSDALTPTEDRLPASSSQEETAPTQKSFPMLEHTDTDSITNYLNLWSQENGIERYKVVRTGEGQFLVFYQKDGIKHADWLTYPDEKKNLEESSKAVKTKEDYRFEKSSPAAAAKDSADADMESYIASMLTKYFG